MIDFLGAILIPHILAASFLLKVATWEVRPDKANGVRADFRLLWAWYRPHWRAMFAHPMYWAGCAVGTAFFLVASVKGVFS